MKENVLLTGATGFVGRNILEDIRSKFNVFCLVRRKTKLDNQILLKNPEQCDPEIYKKLIYEYDVNHIIHVAAITGEKAVSWQKYYITNVLWTKNLALGFLKANIGQGSFIFVSTVGVYGTIPKKLPADEKTPYNPDGKYHLSKVLAEKELLNLNRQFNFSLYILRPTIMYGKYDYGFLYKISRLKFPIFFNPLIHLLDVKKMGIVCLKLLRKRSSGIYNLCDDTPIKLGDLFDATEFPTKFCMLHKIFPAFINIRLKLLCYSWYYDNSKVKKDLKIKFGKTKDNLKKYMWWYKWV